MTTGPLIAYYPVALIVSSRSSSIALLVSALAAAVALAQWPDGHITGNDRDLVARLARGAHQRLDSDAGYGSAEAADPHLLVEPAARHDDAASNGNDAGLPAARYELLRPASATAISTARPSQLRASPGTRPRGRAPPTL